MKGSKCSVSGVTLNPWKIVNINLHFRRRNTSQLEIWNDESINGIFAGRVRNDIRTAGLRGNVLFRILLGMVTKFSIK
jgi:hypothetical protein